MNYSTTTTNYPSKSGGKAIATGGKAIATGGKAIASGGKAIASGGKAIASGGFGCVFYPALKCKNKKRRKGFISKLMIDNYALDEYNEIIDIHEKLDSIPHYEDYFLINDFHLCKPDKLDKMDLKNYGKKCTALPKDDITEKNINKNLDKVLALNMPYGGIPVDDYIYQNIGYSQLIQLNNSLLQLLNQGIIPMNKKHIYHGDIKDSNILVLNNKPIQSLKTRLIDWGLSTTYIPFQENPFPKVWRNRPLQFNVPFSVILFNNEFIDKYTEYLQNGGKKDESSLKPFIMDYIYFWIKKRGDGHYKYINHIMYMLFSHDLNSIKDEKIKTRIIETDFTLFYISNYLTEILLHYTHFRENGTLNLRVYLDKVYIHLLDIYGWVSCYLPLLEILYENYEKMNEQELLLFHTLKKLFIKYLYQPCINPIDVPVLNKDFKNLDILFKSLIDKKKIQSLRSKTSLGRQSTTTGIMTILKSTKKKRNQIKKNRTKRNSYLLFANLKKPKKK